MSSWFTVREYADLKKIATSCVYRKIKKHQLSTKKVGKKTYVSEDLSLLDKQNEIEQQPPMTLEEEKHRISNELLKARIKKLEKETEFQEQKLDSIKQNVLIDFTDLIIIAYSDAYAKFKNDLIALRLNEQQLKTLQDLFSRCTKNFISKVKGLQKNGNTTSEQ